MAEIYLKNELPNPKLTNDNDNNNLPDHWVKAGKKPDFMHYSKVSIDEKQQSVRLKANGTSIYLEVHDKDVVSVEQLSSYHLQVDFKTQSCAKEDVKADPEDRNKQPDPAIPHSCLSRRTAHYGGSV